LVNATVVEHVLRNIFAKPVAIA